MRKMLKFNAYLAISAGILSVVIGVWGLYFTYQNITLENIVTPKDAAIPNAFVRGPFTLKAQADIIRQHTLRATGGLTYAEMPVRVPKLDENGNKIFDEKGEVVTVPNDATKIWITATTLRTALHVGIITYAFSFLVLFLGLISFWTGITYLALSRKFQ